MRWVFLVIAWTMLFGAALSAFAQEARVIEQKIIVIDPTVAAESSWRVQFGAEYWYSYSPAVSWAEGELEGESQGISAYISYDDFTLQVAYRPGSWKGQLQSSNLFGVPSASPLTIRSDQTAEEFEAKIRYLFRQTSILGFTPYVLAGMHFSQVKDRGVVDFTPTIHLPYEYNESFETIEAGLGVVRSFSDVIGMRADVSFGQVYSATSNAYLPSFSASLEDDYDSGFGYNSYVTVYYRLSEHLIGQVGGRFAYEEAQDEQGNTRNYIEAYGAYAAIAYSF